MVINEDTIVEALDGGAINPVLCHIINPVVDAGGDLYLVLNAIADRHLVGLVLEGGR